MLSLSHASLAKGQAHSTVEPEQAARGAFEAGRSAYDDGRFAEALSEFQRAYRLSPRPQLLFNVARAAEADEQPARAVEAYEAYLQALPDADNQAFVRARLAKLRASSEPTGSSDEAPRTGSDRAASPAVAAASEALSVPATAARTMPAATPPAERELRDPPRPWWTRGWFWGVGGAAVAAAITTGIVLSLDHDATRAKADERIMTLVAR